MKKTFSVILLSLGSIVPFIANAEAVCRLNGQIVPCSQLGDALGGFMSSFFWVFILLWLLMVVVFIAGFVLWILMIIHAATKEIDNKAIWIIVLCFTQIIGAIIYYFAVKRPYDKAHMVAVPTGAPAATPATPVNLSNNP